MAARLAHRAATVAVASAAVALGALAAFPLPRTSAQESDLARRKRVALVRGSDWLKRQQARDGGWDYDEKPFAIQIGSGVTHMRQGTTALAVFALLRSGMSPTDSCVTKAFDFIRSGPPQYVYAAGCVLLALEAKYNWDSPDEDDGPGGTVEKKGSRHNKPSGKDLDYAKQCVEFLKAAQARNVWRYPMNETEDSSNAQYALLGLDAAERMGITVSKDVYEKAQEYFVANQERDGPEVPIFPVLGADCSYKDLKAIERTLTEQIRKIDGDFKGKKKGALNAAGHTQEDERRAAEEGAARTVSRSNQPPRMFARGWSYAAGSNPGEEWKSKATGSMTASGLACLFICKAHLEGQARYESSLKDPINKALRDGAGWIAKNWTVAENPGYFLHHYYYLYGLERAGILGLIPAFGDHDWFTDGSIQFLGTQSDDGSWDAKPHGTVGPVCDTSFALLFLGKGTTPIVRLPQRTATGPGSESVPPSSPAAPTPEPQMPVPSPPPEGGE